MPSFNDLDGNEQVKIRLLQKIDTKDFALPMIFCGGSAKERGLFAGCFAEEVVSRYSNTVSPRRAYHPDIQNFYPESKSSIYSMDTIKSFIKESVLPPFESNFSVYIFNEVDRMQDVHANAMLKSLEEKNDSVIILLLVDDINSLLPTLVSRCVRILFSMNKETSDFSYKEKIFEAMSSIQSESFVKANQLFLDIENYIGKDGERFLKFQNVMNCMFEWYRNLATNDFAELDGVMDVFATAKDAFERNIKVMNILEFVAFKLILPDLHFSYSC